MKNQQISLGCCWFVGIVTLLLLGSSSGCYAPLISKGVPASNLPDTFRIPYRSMAAPLNLANLTVRPPDDYILGVNDVLEVTIPDLFQGAIIRPLRAQVMASQEIRLPLVGPVRVGGLNLLQAEEAVNKAYAAGHLKNPRANVVLAAKNTIEVLVLGEVNVPGMHALPKYQNDVGHALAAAGGLNPREAADRIEVHRRLPPYYIEEPISMRPNLEVHEENPDDPKKILKIPLRGLPPGSLAPEDVILQPGDVVFVPSREAEVFYVVGRLSPTNLVRFSLGDRERELGSALILPRNRDIDVVTAVAMAGYIDPIESPKKVTVHRHCPNGQSLLINVDLIKARYDPRQTVTVQAGDIIYLNPTPWWYFRHTLERVVPDLILIPYGDLFTDNS